MAAMARTDIADLTVGAGRIDPPRVTGPTCADLTDTSLPYDRTMSKSLVERRLVEVGDRLKRLRDDLRVADEQLVQFTDEAEDARIRALVSETPLADREHRDAARHADAMRRHREALVSEIAALEQSQDELLDRLVAGG